MKLDTSTEKFYTELMIKKIEDFKKDVNSSKSFTKPWFIVDNKPHNLVSEAEYSGFNNLLLNIVTEQEEYKHPIFITFIQGKSINVFPNKGEKSIPLLKFGYNIKSKEDSSNKNNKIDIQDFLKLNSEEQTKYKIIPFIKKFNVFNIEQTNLKEVNPDLYKEIESQQKAKREIVKEKKYYNHILDDLIKNQKWLTPIELKYQDRAYFTPSLDKIVLPQKKQFKDDTEFYSVLLHEMAHSTGTPERLNRNLSNSFGSSSYAREELVAELTSAITGAKMDMELGLKKNSVSYLNNWLESLKKDPTFLQTLIKDVNRASSMIGSKIDFSNKLELLGFGQEKLSDKGKPYLPIIIDPNKLKNLKENTKGAKLLAITRLREPDQRGNTHAVHNRIKGDKNSEINICFSKDNLEKLAKTKIDDKDKEQIEIYLSELTAEKKQKTKSDYAVYQVDKTDKNNPKIHFVGAGFDAEKDREKEIRNKDDPKQDKQEHDR